MARKAASTSQLRLPQRCAAASYDLPRAAPSSIQAVVQISEPAVVAARKSSKGMRTAPAGKAFEAEPNRGDRPQNTPPEPPLSAPYSNLCTQPAVTRSE